MLFLTGARKRIRSLRACKPATARDLTRRDVPHRIVIINYTSDHRLPQKPFISYRFFKAKSERKNLTCSPEYKNVIK